MCWWMTIRLYNTRYPHRDEKDIPERREIDGMIRLALETVCQTADLSELELDDQEKKEVLDLFAGEQLPRSLREALLRQVAPDPLPDI